MVFICQCAATVERDSTELRISTGATRDNCIACWCIHRSIIMEAVILNFARSTLITTLDPDPKPIQF
jgi:hypothetical protein